MMTSLYIHHGSSPARCVLAPNDSAQSRFTLIELLVVVSIIALLAALLLPALQRAREVARTTVCLSNQKQVSLVWSLYSDEHEGFVPGATSSVNGDSKYYWCNYIDGIDGPGPQVNDSYMGDFAYGPNSVLRCSKNTDTGDNTSVYGVYDEVRNNSEDTEFMVELRDPPTNSYFYSLFDMKRMPEASGFMMLGCTLKKDQGRGTYKFRRTTLSSSPVNTARGLWMIHLGKCNGLFGDGHAETLTGTQLWNVRNGYRSAADTGIRAWKLKDGTYVLP